MIKYHGQGDVSNTEFILTLREEESLNRGKQSSKHAWGAETGAQSSHLQNAITNRDQTEKVPGFQKS